MALIDLSGWPRRSHYEFYRDFDQPHTGVTVAVDVTALAGWCEEHDHSFFLATVHAATVVANGLEPFRLRMRPEGVWLHDTVHPGATVLREDGTFAFTYLEHVEGFEDFQLRARPVVDDARESRSPLQAQDRDDMLFFSVLPWLTFTAVRHAHSGDRFDSVPRIVFGKRYEDGDRLVMPVAIEVHHALMDGLSVGQFVSRFRRRLEGMAG